MKANLTFYQLTSIEIDIGDADPESLSWDDLTQLADSTGAFYNIVPTDPEDLRACLTWDNPDGSFGEAFPE